MQPCWLKVLIYFFLNLTDPFYFNFYIYFLFMYYCILYIIAMEVQQVVVVCVKHFVLKILLNLINFIVILQYYKHTTVLYLKIAGEVWHASIRQRCVMKINSRNLSWPPLAFIYLHHLIQKCIFTPSWLTTHDSSSCTHTHTRVHAHTHST